MLAETSSIKWEITQWRQQMWKRGEDIAASYLERLGWKILERNWYAKRFGELDIIARDPTGLLVFVEVKARMDPLEPGISQVGFESVGRSKQQKLIKAARWYISEHQRYTSGYRFDVIVVTFDEEVQSDVRPSAEQALAVASKQALSNPLLSKHRGMSGEIGPKREGVLSIVGAPISSMKARQRANHGETSVRPSSTSESGATTFSNRSVGPITGCNRELRNASFLDSKLIVHVKQAFP